MPDRLNLLIYLALVINLTPICYGAPGQIWLDFDELTDVNTYPGCTSFLLSDSGSTVNGITIDLSGNLTSARRPEPDNPGEEVLYGDNIYRDFIYGLYPSSVSITLWGLGIGQDCNITLWSFDNNSDPNRIARWYSNGVYIFTTNFRSGEWPWCIENPCLDGPSHAYDAVVTADAFGRIKLTSVIDPNSAASHFAFINALRVIPQGAYVPPIYAQSPQPGDGTENVHLDVILRWKAGDGVEKHDVYFGTNFNDVNDANRSNPLGVLISENQDSNSYDPYGAGGFLKIGTYYYWRIDEVNTTPEPQTIVKGEVWSFLTVSNCLVDDFDSYADSNALRGVWKDYSTNGTSAEAFVETNIVRDGRSMRYRYKNNLPPYHSEVYADIADLGINDPNLSGIGVYTLVLYFYGEPTNPIDEQMYIKLTDGDSPANNSTVFYSNTNDVRMKQWNKWSIPLTEFNDVNLANVARITIGFGDGSPGNAGTVYFEDITLDCEEAEILPLVTGSVDINTVYQELEGFGAAVGWHEWEIPMMPEEKREMLYDTVFNELSLDIFRIRNTYQYDSGYMSNIAQIIAAGKQRNPSLKVMISAWSPPGNLKSNGQVQGGANATLAKDANDPNNSAPYFYVYKKYAQWWADSLEGWSSLGVVADYINIQNEPDYDASWDSCRLNSTESSSIAGYNKAFEAVYQELYSRMGENMPKMLAPETAGFSGLSTYINNLINRNHVYGYAHHLYNGGGSYSYPDGYITSMTNFRTNFNDKPRLQTEFSKGGIGDVTTFPEAMNLAQLMHNTLVFENAAAYVYWELFWTPPKGLVMYSNTNVNNPVYYALKHYSAFIHPGWRRVGTSNSLGDRGNVRISAYNSPDNQQISIVIINLAYSNINLMLDLNGFPMVGSEIYRTSETENTAYIGPFYEAGLLMLPARSIITIRAGTSPLNCADVLAAGYGLTSDIYPDCYVNYNDLKVMTDYWLNTNCGPYDDCEGADFEPTDGSVNLLDLSRFAEQWLWCNDPADSDCTPNWP
ncbi:MAG: hypothetical protein JW947_10965 [Sedimentisphaerales bacterium]|nr:hypothetical protein [Sedimentisphaerales bacterium]